MGKKGGDRITAGGELAAMGSSAAGEHLMRQPPCLGGAEAHIVQGLAGAPPAPSGAPRTFLFRSQLPAVRRRSGAAGPRRVGGGGTRDQDKDNGEKGENNPHYWSDSGRHGRESWGGGAAPRCRRSPRSRGPARKPASPRSPGSRCQNEHGRSGSHGPGSALP